MRLTHNARFAQTIALMALASCSINAAGTATADNPAGTSAPREPVKYRVKEKSLIGNDIVEEGGIALYAGLPSENLEPLCDVGRARAAEYKASNDERVKKMVAANSDTNHFGDPAKFMEAFTLELARERAEHQAQMAQQQETIAKMLELQQTASLNLAEAAKSMATLAAAITADAITAAPAPADPVADVVVDGPTQEPAEPLAKRTRS